ncbi:MAG: acetoacetate decarboxylase family protein [Caulobacterales bacterium]
MPIFGGYKPGPTGHVVIKSLAEDRIDIEAVETLTFTFEVLSEAAIAALPAALHPPFPTYCSLVVRAHADSPFGPFTTAELRLHARATNHYVGYVLGGYTDNAQACAWLRNAYGAPIEEAQTVYLHRRHYGFEARVVAGGRTVVDAVMATPGFISGNDVLYVQNSNLAVLDGAPVLVAEEFEYAIKDAKRGPTSFKSLDLAAFGAPTLTLSNHLPSTWTAGAWSYMPVRFTIDPNKPAMAGTRKVGQPAAA